ncbi:MAG: ABC transporter permease [Bacteroidota bacterium]
MNTTWLIFRREYLNLVRKKTFLISTFLVPLGLAAIFGIQIFATLNVEKETVTVLIAKDNAPEITQHLTESDNLSFEYSDLPHDSLEAKVLKNKDYRLLTIGNSILEKKTGNAVLLGSQQPSKELVDQVEDKLKVATKKYKNTKVGISEDQLEAAKFNLDVDGKTITKKGVEEGSETLAMIIGFAVSMLMYMLMAIYGSVLMQGIIEEKSNRIVEVIVSSVQPFRLLLGKTLAIASAGLTQFLLWTLLSGVVLLVLSFVTAGMIDPSAMSSQPGVDVEMTQNMLEDFMIEAQNFSWGTLLWAFPIYFLGGFFLYGSLMAAAGSAVDNIQDAQQFTLPITLPMIVPMILLYNIIANPNSTLAVVLSLIPFTSPMTMLIRLSMATVPWYQVAISLILLIGGFLGCVWLAARIYRTGILMYGKKPSFKEIFRWVRYQ